MTNTEREAVKGLLRTIGAAIAAGDWKVDGACDPDLDIRRVRALLFDKDREGATRPRRPSYLKKRNRVWYAQVAVPLALQEIVGKKTLQESLKTADRRVAEQRVEPVVQKFRRKLEGVRARPSPVA